MTKTSDVTARVGDWLEVNGAGVGSPRRRRQILEVLGHPHFRVRWDEEHVTLYYPAHGATAVRRTDEITRTGSR
jgi:hypothetical protein